MVKQHQGWIEVESQPGKGACLPHHSALLGETPPKTGGAGQPLVKVQGGKETILVVEDESALRELVREILEGHGYQILEAGYGVEALQVWQAHGKKN